MFASVELAARIDAAEAQLTLRAGRAAALREPGTRVEAMSGGAAVQTVSGSPFDKVIGLGFAPFDAAAFERFEEHALARAGWVQVELSSLADPAVAGELARRGYDLVGFENVLGIELRELATAPASRVAVTRVGPGDIEAWLDAAVTASAHPDVGDGPASHESFSSEILERALRDIAAVEGFMAWIARLDGSIAGTASMRIDRERRVAQLTGASTLPALRRRGVQTALFHARLAEAAAAGAEVAVVTTRPGSRSMENAMRSGLSLLYVRAVLVRSA